MDKYDPTLNPMVDSREAFENADDPQWEAEYAEYLDAQHNADDFDGELEQEEVDDFLDGYDAPYKSDHPYGWDHI